MHSKLSLLPVVGLILATGHRGAKASPTCLSEGFCNDVPLPSNVSKRHWYDDPDWVPADGGCWSDNVDGVRALETMIEECDEMTPDKCQWLCKNAGFSLAGVEYSRECWCGNTIFGNNHPIASEMCNSPCSGDPSMQCGGGNAIHLSSRRNYVFAHGPAAPLDSYHGYYRTQCFEDSIDDRVLDGRPTQEIPADYMTAKLCIDGCKAAGFSSAGLEFGKECYCGDVQFPPSQYEDLEDCNMPCLGDASEYCGGGNRILIYTDNPSITFRGLIEVTSQRDGQSLGFIAKDTFNEGHYKYVSSELDALHVYFNTPSGSTAIANAELITENSNIAEFYLLGLVQGRDNSDSDLHAGSYHYAYIASTNATARDSTPKFVGNSYSSSTGLSRTSESHVWSIDVVTGETSLTWVNSNGEIAVLQYWAQSNALYVGGDQAAFNFFNPAAIIPVAFKFLSRPSSCDMQ